MNLIFIEKVEQNLAELLVSELKQTESIEEVANILKPYRQRGVFLEIIDHLLNELSEAETENKDLIRKYCKKNKEEIEIL